MKKNTKELMGKKMGELHKEAETINEDITKLQLEAKVRPQKDTNMIMKKRKLRAQILTVMKAKRDLEMLQKSEK